MGVKDHTGEFSNRKQKYIIVWEELHPAESSRPLQMVNKSSQVQSCCPAGKGVVIPSSGECPESFSQMALLGMVCVGVYIIYA